MAPIPLVLRFTHPFLFFALSPLPPLSREHSLKKSPPKKSGGEDRIQEWKWDKRFERGARRTRELEKEIFYCLRHEISFEDLRRPYPTLLAFCRSHPLTSSHPHPFAVQSCDPFAHAEADVLYDCGVGCTGNNYASVKRDATPAMEGPQRVRSL